MSKTRHIKLLGIKCVICFPFYDLRTTTQLSALEAFENQGCSSGCDRLRLLVRLLIFQCRHPRLQHIVEVEGLELSTALTIRLVAVDYVVHSQYPELSVRLTCYLISSQRTD